VQEGADAGVGEGPDLLGVKGDGALQRPEVDVSGHQ
jgi:hypothetical protein